jgi:hypothetical protein
MSGSAIRGFTLDFLSDKDEGMRINVRTTAQKYTSIYMGRDTHNVARC